MRYWIADRSSCSTWSASNVKRGGCPDALTLALDTIAWKVPCTVPATTGSACE